MHPESRIIKTVSVHVGGDLHEIVLGGVQELAGSTVLEKMSDLKENHDGLRQLLLDEPRGGRASNFADLVVKPSEPGAQAGFIIMEYMGYPLYSGSNTMATAIALLEEGGLPMTDGVCEVVLESPGGLVVVSANCHEGRVVNVTYSPDTASFVDRKDLVAEVVGRGKVYFDIVWSGCYYAVIDATQHGFNLSAAEERELSEFSRAFFDAVRDLVVLHHPCHGDQGALSFILWTAPTYRNKDGNLEQRISPVVYPHSVSRCPSGTGTSAAIALLVETGEMKQGDCLNTLSCWDSPFFGECYRIENLDLKTACRARVTGEGWVVSRTDVVVNPRDPLTPADGLWDVLTVV